MPVTIGVDPHKVSHTAAALDEQRPPHGLGILEPLAVGPRNRNP